jgi:hypothetical protein
MLLILTIYWSANFAIYDGLAKTRMKEATNELASLNYSLNIGSEEMPIKKTCAIGIRRYR